MKKITFLLALALSTTIFAQTTVVDVNFANYTNGALVSQNSWVQYKTLAENPLTITNGKVTWLGNGAPTTPVDNQDAMLPFASTIIQPTSGTTTVNVDLLVAVSTAGDSPSYFFALNTLNTTSTSNNFQNARLAAKASTDGFVFGARVNGQSGYPFAYGTTKLTFGAKYAVRMVLELVAGNANDVLKLYVGSDFNNLTLEATSSYSTGSVTDPTFGALLISQFGNSTNFESGISIESIKVTNLGAASGLNTTKESKLEAIVSGKNLLVKNVTEGSEVEIFSAVGSKVLNAAVENGKVNIANLKSGMYVVRSGKLTQKIRL